MQLIGDLHSRKLRVKIGRRMNYGIYYIDPSTEHFYSSPSYHVMLDVKTFSLLSLSKQLPTPVKKKFIMHAM